MRTELETDGVNMMKYKILLTIVIDRFQNYAIVSSHDEKSSLDFSFYSVFEDNKDMLCQRKS